MAACAIRAPVLPVVQWKQWLIKLSLKLFVSLLHLTMTSEEARERNVRASDKRDEKCPCQTHWSKTTPLFSNCRQDLSRVAGPPYLSVPPRSTFRSAMRTSQTAGRRNTHMGLWIVKDRFHADALQKTSQYNTSLLSVCLMVQIQRLPEGQQ